MKKSIAMCIALAMMSQTAFAAVTCTENLDTSKITVTGPIDGTAKTGIVSLEMTNPSGEIVHSNFIPADLEGNFSYTFKLPADAVTGRYNLTFNTYGLAEPETAVLDHECEQDILNIIAALNNAADVAAVKTILENNKSKLGLEKWYGIVSDTSKTAAAQAVFDGRGDGYTNAAMADIKRKILGEIANDCFVKVTTEADMDEAIKVFADVLNLSETAKYYADYQELSSENAKTAREIMAENADEMKNASSIFDIGVILVEIANAKQPGDIKTLIDDNTSYLTQTAADTYAKSDKAATARYINGKSCKSMKELSSVIIDAYNAQKKTTGGGSSGGSSGGGGSSSGGTSNPGTLINPGTPIATVAPKSGFKDIESVSWAAEAINSLADKGIIKGIDEETFDPMSELTREQFAMIIVNAFDLADDGAEVDFADMEKTHWAYKAVAAANKKGIINGVGDGLFGKGQAIKRCDIAVMAVRAAKAAGLTFSETNIAELADIDSLPEYARESVITLVKAGVINGFKEDNTFRGNETATRAQAAQIVFNLLKEAK